MTSQPSDAALNQPHIHPSSLNADNVVFGLMLTIGLSLVPMDMPEPSLCRA